jgi:lipoprotein-anchoring transpeptidase ErfK/SrfK
VVKLNGKLKRVGGEKFYSTSDGDLVRASDVGLIVAPRTFPKAAEDGEKWIEVNVTEQTLVLWEGKRPVYATLVSTGREEYPTVLGEFRIKNKHITATMDSDESSSVGGGAPRRASRTEEGSSSGKSDPPKDKKKAEPKDPKKGAKPPAKGAAPEAGAKPGAKAPEKVPSKGDGEYGVTKRRGEGTYQLRDVPYIQYFAAGYALHAAYWHDVFGKQKSHGCINLSPIDAHRVFMWTEPAIPDGWHAINTGDEFGEGTVVIVHE